MSADVLNSPSVNIVPMDVLPADATNYTMETAFSNGRPKRRFATAQGVYDTLQAMELIEQSDAVRRAMLQGMMDGNPPYRQADLVKAGLGKITNVNFLGLRGMVEGRIGLLDDIIGPDSRLVDLTPRRLGSDRAALQDVGDVIADEFSTAVHDWQGLGPLLEAASKDRDLHGMGIAIFPDPTDWRPVYHPRGSLRMTDMADIDPTKNDVFAVEGRLDAGELFRVVTGERTESGWDIEGVMNYLVSTYVKKEDNESQGANKFGTSPVESMQAMIRDNIWFDTRQFDVVRVYHVFAKEVTPGGGVSHIILPPQPAGQAYWFYYKEKEYARMDEVLWWMTSGTGSDGRLRSLRGMASYLAPLCDLENRFLGRAYDMVWDSSMNRYQAVSKADPSTMRFIRHGQNEIVPPELKAITSQLQNPNWQQLMTMKTVGIGGAMGNVHGGVAAGAQDDPQTAQMMRRASDKHNVALSLRALAKLFPVMMKRMVGPTKNMPYDSREIAENFRESVTSRGVTEEQLKRVLEDFHVRLSREIVLGGPMALAQTLGGALQLRPGMDEAGAKRLKRDFLSVVVGRRNVDRYEPLVDKLIMTTNAKSFAQMENNQMIQGQAVIAGADQPHKEHIATHIQIPQSISQSVQQGRLGDPQKAAATMELSLGHVVEHLSWYGKDKAFAEEAKQMRKQLDPLIKLMQYIQKIAQQQAKMQQAQAQAQQKAQAEYGQQTAEAQAQFGDMAKDPKFILEKYKIDRDIAVQEYAQKSLNGMRAEKTKTQNDIARWKAHVGVGLEREKNQLDAAAAAAPQEPAPDETAPEDDYQ